MQLRGLPQHAARVVQEGFARRRQAHAACFTIEQWQASLCFKCLDAGAGGGQRQVLPGAGAGEVTFIGGEDKKAQVREVEMHQDMLARIALSVRKFRKLGL